MNFSQNLNKLKNAIFLGLATTLVGLLMNGCVARESPDVESPAKKSDSFSASGADTVPDRWWNRFDDPILNHLVSRSLQGNLSLKQSWNRLAEARAVIERNESDLYPALDVTADYDDRKTRRSSSTDISQSSGLGLTADYEIDLWGRIESSVEASRFDAKASQFDLRSAAISLSAEVSRTWYQLVEQYSQRSVLQDQIQTNEKVLQLVEKRFEMGQVRMPDVLRQRRLVDSTREQKTSVESRIEVLENKLAVLLGQLPSEKVNPVRISFPDIPALPETGVPARVIDRRPDVRASFMQVKSANKQVATAIANQYPRISITGSLTTDGGDEVNFFDNWIQSLAADFALPLIDAGQRDAEVSRSKAVLARRVNEYREAVITAYQEVENALVREKKQRKQIELIEKQLKSAQSTVDRLRSQYIKGSANYLDVLDALENKQQLERDLLSAKTQLFDHRIALYRALAGGLEVEKPLSESS